MSLTKDRIAEDEKFLEELRNYPGHASKPLYYHVEEWVDVNDKLPPDHVRVLGYLKGHGFIEIVHYSSEKDEWRSEMYNLLIDVTHWRSLPNPPK
jgi:hypothetical protein